MWRCSKNFIKKFLGAPGSLEVIRSAVLDFICDVLGVPVSSGTGVQESIYSGVQMCTENSQNP